MGVCSFLDISGYYQIYIKDYAKIVAPVLELTKQDEEFVWSPCKPNAFEALRLSLITTLVLIQLDFVDMFILDVDWSQKRVGVVLSQKQNH